MRCCNPRKLQNVSEKLLTNWLPLSNSMQDVLVWYAPMIVEDRCDMCYNCPRSGAAEVSLERQSSMTAEQWLREVVIANGPSMSLAMK